MQDSINHPRLYKMDSKGKIRVWSIAAVLPTDDDPYYEQIHGENGGKLQESRTYVRQGKNVGKKNETSPWQQCQKEALAKWVKKRDNDQYQEDFPTSQPISPMRAKKAVEDKIKFPCYVQPKLDGVRCLAMWRNGKVKLVSRGNKEFTTLEHISDAMIPLLINNQELIFDGELYNHDYHDDFQNLISGIKKGDKNEHTKNVQFHIYDVITPGGYKERAAVLAGFNNFFGDELRRVDTRAVFNFESLHEVEEKHLADGYEGCMIRYPTGEYKFKSQSSELLKYKRFDDAEFKILDAKMNTKGRWEGTCAFVCEVPGGTFDVMPKGDQEVRDKYWTDWQNGKIKAGDQLTVRYFGWTTSVVPKPRFPIGIAIRDYE